RELEDLRRRDAERAQRLREMEEKLDALDTRAETPPPAAPAEKADAGTALDRAIESLNETISRPAGTDIASKRVGGAKLRLIDVSLDALFYAGGSTERDAGLQTLQAGGHDPKKRGFTFAQGELSLMGAVDPYFTAEAHLIFLLDPVEGETEVELEEAVAKTTALPWGLQLKAGQYFTEIGRINPTHPHAWDFSDQPLVNNRFFGPDGLRSPGARLSWLAPLPWYSELFGGVQNAIGETTESFLANDEVFEERAVGGRPFADRDFRDAGDLLYAMRWANSVDLTEEITALAGASGLIGPNNAGRSTSTYIYGGDLTVKWRPRNAASQWPFVKWQSEAYQRIYEADGATFENDPADPLDDLVVGDETFHDWGLYSQLLVGFAQGWVAGARYEYVSGSDDPTIALDEDTG
ncbi:MAG: hypothetical protein K8I02_10615, partial [Candidatus Methylomirabilis sp.]|nr:hypothetical protein [Deltaproteobacteria bacterium]